MTGTGGDGEAGPFLVSVLVRGGHAVGPYRHPDLLEAALADECVQRFDGAAEIGDGLIEGLDLLLQMRDALAVGDYRSQFLSTIQASAYRPDF